jgi:hypothetical protein
VFGLDEFASEELTRLRHSLRLWAMITRTTNLSPMSDVLTCLNQECAHRAIPMASPPDSSADLNRSLLLGQLASWRGNGSCPPVVQSNLAGLLPQLSSSRR